MYLFFDTETTGLPRDWNAPIKDLSNWPRIVQIAWVEYDERRKLVSQGDYLIKPDGFIIPEEVSRIHKISQEEATNYGEPLKQVLTLFNLLIEKSEYIIGHNIDFDIKVLSAEFLREYMASSLSQKKKICTMESTVDFMKLPSQRGGYKFPSLADLSRRLYGEAFKNAHNALVDIQNNAKIFWDLFDQGVINFNSSSEIKVEEDQKEVVSNEGLTLF